MTIDTLAVTLDVAIKLSQITFYVIGACIAILTYRAAKRGLLNTVNTEYQKRVIDRLQKMSEDLYAEYDDSSEHFWFNQRIVDLCLNVINKDFLKHRAARLKDGRYYGGMPIHPSMNRLRAMLDALTSDPFVPPKIRQQVVSFLERRLQVSFDVISSEMTAYANSLAKGEIEIVEPSTDNAFYIQNRIVDRMRKAGCGIEDVAKGIHDIRRSIQDHLQSFDPLATNRNA